MSGPYRAWAGRSFDAARLAMVLALFGCRETAPPAPRGPAPDAHLMGQRAVVRATDGAVVHVFGGDAWPRFRIEDSGDTSSRGRIEATINGIDLPLTVPVHRVGGRIVAVDATRASDPGPGVHTLTVSVGGSEPAWWPARWTPTAAEARVWVEVETAQAQTREGHRDAAAERWLAAGEMARVAGMPTVEARALLAVASIRHRQHRFVDARFRLDEAAAISADATDAEGQVDAAWHRGRIDEELGRYHRATAHYRDAFDRAWALGLDARAGSIAQALAILLGDMGRHDEAIETLDGVAPHYESNRDDDGGAYLVNRAGVELRAMAAGARPPDYPAVRARFDAARSHLRADGGHLSERYGPKAWMGAAWAAHLQRDAVGARHALDEARALDPRGAGGFSPAFARRLDAELKYGAGELDAALAMAIAAVEAARVGSTADDAEARWRALHVEGRIRLDRGELDAAAARWNDAIAELDRLARRAPLGPAPAPFLVDRTAPARDAIALALRRGDAAGALALADADRARVFGTLAARARVETLPPDALDEWSRRIGEWRAARAAGEASRDRGAALDDTAHAERRRETAGLLDAAYTWLDDRVPTVDPRSVHALPPKKIADRVPRGAALLVLHPATDAQPASAPPRWWVWWVEAGRVDVSGPTDAPLDVRPERWARAPRLYVVDGGHEGARVLHTREVGDGAALGERTAIAYLPYAGLLGRSMPSGTDSKGPPLIIADPNGDLPGARAEGRAVAARWPDARMLDDSRATRDAVLDALPTAEHVHFAGHCMLRPGAPWDAHLRLFESGALTFGDVLAQGSRASLVVLSGCETGVSPPSAGPRAVGLAEAFVFAGAGAVLAADRPLPDAAPAAFVDAFHAAVIAGAPPAEALRATVVDRRRAGDLHWAAWRLVGG